MKIPKCSKFSLRCVLQTYAISVLLVYLFTGFRDISTVDLFISLCILFVVTTIVVYLWMLVYPSDDFVALKRGEKER